MSRRFFRNLPALFMCLLLVGACEQKKTTEQYVAEAKVLHAKGDIKGAVIQLKNALSQSPQNVDARLALGTAQLELDEFAAAEKELEKARELGAPVSEVLPPLARALYAMGEYQDLLTRVNPVDGLSSESLASVYATRASAQLALHKADEAAATLAEAGEIPGDYPELLLARARLSLARQDLKGALAFVDEAIRHDGKFIDAWFLKAALLQSTGKSGDALAAYQNILKVDPRKFSAHLQIAHLDIAKGELVKAAEQITAAEKISPANPQVRYARALVNFRQGKVKEAGEVIQGVLKASPDHLPSLLLRGAVYVSQGSYERARGDLKRVLARAPRATYARRLLAVTQLKMGEPRQALETLQPLLKAERVDALVLALAGEAYLRIGDFARATDYLEKAAVLIPKAQDLKTQLALSRMAGGDVDRATDDLEAIAKATPGPSKADTVLILTHLQRRDYDAALAAIQTLEKKVGPNPVTHNFRGAALLGKRDKAGARIAFEQALAVQPTFFPAAINLARLDMAENKPEIARRRFESLLARDKNNVRAMVALANLAAAGNREKEHVEWLEKAGKADPKAIEPRAGLVRHYLNRKENQKALALARETSGANPESLEAMNLLGATQLAIGDPAAAIATFSRMTQKAPQSADLFLRLALAQMADKRLNEARASLQKSLQLKPDFVRAQDVLARLELEDRKPEAALQIARQIQKKQPASALGFEREGDILLSQKRFPQAAKAYEQALAKGAGSTGLIKLHQALHLAGDAKSAEQRLGGWLTQYPKDLPVHLYAAGFYMATHRDRDAIAQYEEVLRLAPRNVAALGNLAVLYQRARDSRALMVAEQAYRVSPDQSGIQDILGWILVDRGQLPRALELLSKAVAKAPMAGGIRYHYAVALARTGRKTEARRTLEDFVGDDQNYPEIEQARALLRTL